MAEESNNQSEKIDAVVWGLLFIWAGIAFWADVGWGIGLIGIGIILMGEQFARRIQEVKYEGFWALVGGVAFLSGVLMVYGIEFSIFPVILIVIGIAILFSLFRY